MYLRWLCVTAIFSLATRRTLGCLCTNDNVSPSKQMGLLLSLCRLCFSVAEQRMSGAHFSFGIRAESTHRRKTKIARGFSFFTIASRDFFLSSRLSDSSRAGYSHPKVIFSLNFPLFSSFRLFDHNIYSRRNPLKWTLCEKSVAQILRINRR